MRNRTAARWGLAAGLLAGVVGCDLREEKLPQKIPPKATEPAPGKDGPTAPPADSDPAAKAVIDQAIKAHTEGRPERLERAKVHRLSAKRTLFAPQGEIESTWTSQAVWPDKVAFVIQSDAPGFRTNTFVVNGGRGWIVPEKEPAREMLPTEARELLTDVAVETWGALLVPLADPAARATAATTGTANGRPCTTVRVASPVLPPNLTASFDTQTGLLVQLDYPGREAGLPMDKSLRLTDHKSVAGLLVPGKWESTHAGRVVARWTIGNLEFPEQIDPKVFQP